MLKKLTFEEYCKNFWKKVKKTNCCWIWTGQVTRFGYGKYTLRKGFSRHAHRISYEITRETIPKGLQIDHLCRNRLCVNPDHLEPVTCKININRGVNHNRTKKCCPKGHEYSEDNLYMEKINGKFRGRRCKICIAITQKKIKMRLENAN